MVLSRDGKLEHVVGGVERIRQARMQVFAFIRWADRLDPAQEVRPLLSERISAAVALGDVPTRRYAADGI